MRGSFIAGLIAALLGLVSLAPLSLATANDTIDPTTTGAVTPGATVQAVDTQGSAQFKALLAALVDGEDVPKVYGDAALLTSAVERMTLQWAAIYHHAGVVDYQAIARFAVEAPEYAAPELYRARIEQSLTKAAPSGDTVIATLGTGVPLTVDGQIGLAAAYRADGQQERAASLARAVWIDNFLTLEQEAEVLAKLGALLDRDAHWQRAVHLMMHDRAQGSERLLPYLDGAQSSLIVARAAVSRNDGNAKALLDAVDPTLQNHPVYLFSRAQRARQFELWQDAVQWLNKAPADLPDAAEWWYERRTLTRKLLDVGQPRLAYEASAGYTHGPEGRLVEAHFHAGWIALSFLKDAAAAKAHFTAMAGLSTLADSITQANYWLGRANIVLGDVEAARQAFQAAARYGTVYYGQLAQTELGQSGVSIRPLPAWQQSETIFNSHAVVQSVRLLAANGQGRLAIPLLRHYGNGLSNGGELLLAARLAQELEAQNLAISIANIAEQRGTPLDPYSFPDAGLAADLPLAAERAAVFAVVRQESMFQVDAVSSAGARGLMQLMPGTAEDVARVVGVGYSATRLLTDPAYNTLLGSTYLNTQLQRYDGSLVLAAAAYNAGPGNADKWIRAYGDPRASNVDPVIWVELIPFQETRTYVKRVLGNYLVYRERFGATDMTLQQALRTID